MGEYQVRIQDAMKKILIDNNFDDYYSDAYWAGNKEPKTNNGYEDWESFKIKTPLQQQEMKKGLLSK